MLPLLNNLAFFILYTLLRVFLFPVLISVFMSMPRHFDLWNTAKFVSNVGDPRAMHITSTMTQLCFIAILVLTLFMLGLNLFWYSLILKNVAKTIKGLRGQKLPGKKIMGDVEIVGGVVMVVR